MAEIIFEQEFQNGRFSVYNQRPDLADHGPVMVHQVHGSTVVSIDDASAEIDADGIWAPKKNTTPLAVLTADCLPILVIGAKGHALLHAGWRGIHAEIFLVRQIHDLGPELFFIGPHIMRDSFEVQTDFKKHFPDSAFFKDVENRLTFDLQGHCTQRINEVFPKALIKTADLDTYAQKRFHSFRRDKTSLRNWNVFSPHR